MNNTPSNSSILLIGYRCSGKSTIGKLLASKLRLPFIDTDHLIEEQSNRSITDIFNQDGQRTFRKLEQKTILQLTPTPVQIIATGGGCVENELARHHLRTLGKIIFLNPPLESIRWRMHLLEQAGKKGPSLTGRDWKDEVESVMQRRLDHYELIADLRIDSPDKADAIASLIIEKLNLPLSK